jgi:hypothetical protein
MGVKMDTNKILFQHLERLKSMSMEHDRQRAEINESLDFFATDDSDANQIVISFLHEYADQIGAAQRALDSAIRCLTQ